MKSLCLISSDQHEIDRFKYENRKIDYIISNIDGYISPCPNSIEKIFSCSDLCIIGETINFSDEFISRIVHTAHKNNISVVNYHISNDNQNIILERIQLPVIFICSLLPDMGKSEIGAEISRNLSKYNLNPLFITSNPMWKEYNYLTFPYELLKKENPIFELNNFFVRKSKENSKNVIVLCVPGGIISSPKYNLYCDYGLLNYVILHAVQPNYILNCVHQNTVNLKAIPEPFLPYRIDSHIRTDRVLDQNVYDFIIKNRNIKVTNELSENDGIYNVFDTQVYEKIAQEIVKKIR